MLPALAEQGVEVLAATPDDEVAATLRDSGIRWFRLAATRRVDLDYARTFGGSSTSRGRTW